MLTKCEEVGGLTADGDRQMALTVQPVDLRWMVCSKNVRYQGTINGLLQELRETDSTDFRRIQKCLGILPHQITSWYM